MGLDKHLLFGRRLFNLSPVRTIAAYDSKGPVVIQLCGTAANGSMQKARAVKLPHEVLRVIVTKGKKFELKVEKFGAKPEKFESKTEKFQLKPEKFELKAQKFDLKGKKADIIPQICDSKPGKPEFKALHFNTKERKPQ